MPDATKSDERDLLDVDHDHRRSSKGTPPLDLAKCIANYGAAQFLG